MIDRSSTQNFVVTETPAMSNPEPKTPNSRSHEDNNVASSAEWRNAATTAVNEQNTRQNSDIRLTFPSDRPINSDTIFKSTTLAPSPPLGTSTSSENNKPLSLLDTTSCLLPTDIQHASPNPLSAGLRIQTDIIPGYIVTAASTNTTARSSSESTRIPSK